MFFSLLSVSPKLPSKSRNSRGFFGGKVRWEGEGEAASPPASNFPGFLLPEAPQHIHIIMPVPAPKGLRRFPAHGWAGKAAGPEQAAACLARERRQRACGRPWGGASPLYADTFSLHSGTARDTPLIPPLWRCFGAGRRSGRKPRRPCFPVLPRQEAFLSAPVRQVHGIPALPRPGGILRERRPSLRGSGPPPQTGLPGLSPPSPRWHKSYKRRLVFL